MYSSVINGSGSGSIDDIQDKKYTINHENISYYERFKHHVKKILEEKIDEEAPLPDKYKEVIKIIRITITYNIFCNKYHNYNYNNILNITITIIYITIACTLVL